MAKERKRISLTPDQVRKRLPARDFWFCKDIAIAFGTTLRTIQISAKKNGMGTKVRQGPAGTYVFTEKDLKDLCYYVNGTANHERTIKNREIERIKNAGQMIRDLNNSLFGPPS